LGYILLLLLSAIPLQSIAFLFGGVSVTEVGVAFVLLFATALLLGALGMFFSSMTDRTMTATVRVYTVSVFLVFALPLATVFLYGGAFGNAISGVDIAGTSDPVVEASRIYGDMVVSSLNPITSAFYTQQMLIEQQQIFLLDVELENNTFIPVIAPWLITTVMYIGATAMLLLLAIRRMRHGM